MSIPLSKLNSQRIAEASNSRGGRQVHDGNVTLCRAVVQIMLTSAYIGYGVASLDQDASEIHTLVDLLRQEFGAKVRHCHQSTFSMPF